MMSANDSIDSLEPVSPVKHDSTVLAKGAQALTMRQVIFNAWGDLIRPRESLLIRYYMQWAGDLGDDLIAPITLDEARRRYESTRGRIAPTDSARDAVESQMLVCMRVCAAWIVAWTMIPPATIIVWLGFRDFRLRPGWDWSRLAQVLLYIVVLFPIFSFLGLAVQSVFIRPFNALMTRILPLPGGGPGHDRHEADRPPRPPNQQADPVE
jgi:hypothetical protein